MDALTKTKVKKFNVQALIVYEISHLMKLFKQEFHWQKGGITWLK